jgi:hypothetical protein
MGDPPRTGLLVLTDSIIDALATNPTVVANFGGCFTAAARTAAADCRKCPAARRRGQEVYAQVRRCIDGLPPARKALLKRLLNADRVRVLVRREGSTRVIELTF